jgi:hypothetical protein
MSETTKTQTLSRREITGLATAAAALAASPALAGQPRMQAALSHCQIALSELQNANNNKGGHRRKAIEHLKYVIDQIKEGIAHAA